MDGWLTAAHQDESDPIETTFELNDTLFAKAEVPPTDEVYIWLGANVMLAYPTDEAETLLVERLGKAKKSLVDCEEDAEFLREQITVGRHNLCFVLVELAAYTLARPWRSRRPEYTTGTSCRSARKRARRRARRRTTRPVVAEAAAQGVDRSLRTQKTVVTGSPRQLAHREGRVESKRSNTACKLHARLESRWASRAPRIRPGRPGGNLKQAEIAGWLAVK